MIRGRQKLIRKPPSASLLYDLAHLFNVEAAAELELGEKQRLSSVARQLYRRGDAAAAISVISSRRR